MQRSHKALLRRRALDKNCMRMISLSLVFAFWGLVFLLSLWISQGDSYVDGSASFPVGMSTWNDTKMGQNQLSGSADYNPSKKTGFINSDESSSTYGDERRGSNDDSLANEGDTNLAFPLEQPEASSGSIATNASRNERVARVVPPGLDEFKSRAFSSKSKSGNGQAGGIVHRMEPGGKEYNYASASKGAKVLAFNKEAKGVSNILGRDKDKYLRNPCSAEEKFVEIELSEETLVDTIEIANFEHYSSNLKYFELLGSLVYPTDMWIKLGNFTAANGKHAQRFALTEPKWVRYLKFDIRSHYGSEFYCTLSFIEVYGVDAVERMLEDLISVPENLFASREGNGEQKSLSPQLDPSQGDDLYQDVFKEMESDSSFENPNVKHEVLKSNVPDPVEEIRHQQASRMPGDTALKVLMQKVRSLDLSLSVLERYLEEVNSRYGNIFRELDNDLGEKDILIKNIQLEMKDFLDSQKATARDVGDLVSWQSIVSRQLDNLLKENSDLRSMVEMVRENQKSMENKGMVIFLICLIFGFVAFLRLFVDMLLSVYTAFSVQRTEKPRKFCSISSSWFFLLSSCSAVILILSM
uniref:SUN domain-containing protein n=1 Tax=Rhizophora mucronata TaxID=61149 RepID=A0A2P2JQJ3_RHIMU